MNNKKIRDISMNDNFELKGSWWFEGQIDERVNGTLTYDENDTVLELVFEGYPSYENKNKNIYGVISSGDLVSLYGCVQFHQSFSGGQYGAMTILKFSISKFIIGGIHDENELLFKESNIMISGFDEWKDQRPINVEINNKHKTIKGSIDICEANKGLIKLKSNDESLVVTEYVSSNQNYDNNNFSIEVIRYLKIEISESKGLSNYIEILDNTRKFFEFLMNRPVFFNKISFVQNELNDINGEKYQDGHKFYLFYNNKRFSKKVSDTMLTNYRDIYDKLENAFKIWTENTKLIVPIYNQATSRYNKVLDIENVFLDNSKALEMYDRNIGEHQRDKKKKDSYIKNFRKEILKFINEKDMDDSYKKFFIDRINYPDSTTFKSRLLFILDSLDYTTIKSILVVNDDEIEESKSNFSKMIVDTRNYITHKDNSNIKPTVIMDRVQLLVASYQLGLIIIILIAKFIGLDEAIITDKVKQSNMQHIVSNNIKK